MRIPTDRPQMRFLFPHKKHYPKGTDKAMENNGKKIIYADNAATTAVSPAVLEAMLPYYTECYGNPSSLYALGTAAKKPLEEARAKVAKCLGAEPNEIYFTSCGSESDNWAIKGAAHKMLKKGKNHIITSKFEHHAVLHTCAALEKEGFEVTYLDVHENGIVVPEELERERADLFAAQHGVRAEAGRAPRPAFRAGTPERQVVRLDHIRTAHAAAASHTFFLLPYNKNPGERPGLFTRCCVRLTAYT